MNKKQKVVLMRGLRSLGAVLVAALAGWLAGPQAADIVGEQGQAIVSGVLIPALLMLDKYLRFGSVVEDA